MVNKNRWGGSWNNSNGLSNRICTSNERENVNVFNMISRINNQKLWQNIFHLIVNVNLIVENVV